MLSLSDLLATFPGLDQFAVAFGVDGMVVSQQSIAWGDISDSTVESHVVVMRDIVGDDSSSILQGQGRLDTDAFALQRFVPTFDLAVGLGMVKEGPRVGHASNSNKLLEILGNELRSIVGDDARSDIGMELASTLQDGFHVDFLHFFADFPVDDESAEAIEDGAEEVESASDIEIADIDVPFVMRRQRLHIARPFFGEIRAQGQRAVQLS